MPAIQIRGHLSKFMKRSLKRIFPAGSSGRRWLMLLRAQFREFVHMQAGESVMLAGLIKDLESWAGERDGGVYLIVSPVRFRENEGQRAMNFTVELFRRGAAVVFVYWRWPGEPCESPVLDEGLLQIPMDMFLEDPGQFLRSFTSLEKYVLVEYPNPGLFGPLCTARAAGWITVYDLIDDWAAFHKVGQAHWYDPSFERWLLQHADVLVQVRKELDAPKVLGGRRAALVPNGLAPEAALIDQRRRLRRGEITLGYFGYLSDAWFDWPMILQVAERNPTWMIYLIGYGLPLNESVLPRNVVCLGKKPRSQLASFAANWDVAVVPFKREAAARGADPIKTYEYLAMGLPVVVSGVNAPEGGEDYVYCASDAAEFAECVLAAAGEEPDPGRKHFAGRCSWEKRLGMLLEAVQQSKQVKQMKFLFGVQA